MPRLTAKEAREIAGRNLDDKLDSILEAIEQAAKDQKRELRTGYSYKQDEDLWIRGGYDRSSDWQEARKVLQDLGYTVEFFYSEGQFVNMYTVIKW